MLQNAKIEKKITFPDKFADAETLTNDKVKKNQIVFEEETLLHAKNVTNRSRH